eukprot:g3970.t1
MDRFLQANEHSPYPRTAGFVANSILLLIFASTLLNVVETDPTIYAGQHEFFRVFEAICVVIFTVEFLLRLYVTPMNKGRFICQPLHIIDILAFLPWYIEQIINSIKISGKIQEQIATLVLILRVPRALRLLRVARYSQTLQVFLRAVVESTDALLILIFLICLALILFATMIHFAERGDVFIAARLGDGDRGWWSYSKDGTVEQRPFWSVPRAMWWCMATLTTVGYGDEYPVTNTGKIIAAFAMLSGILIIALPVSVLGTNFAEAYDKMIKVKELKRTASKMQRMPRPEGDESKKYDGGGGLSDAEAAAQAAAARRATYEYSSNKSASAGGGGGSGRAAATVATAAMTANPAAGPAAGVGGVGTDASRSVELYRDTADVLVRVAGGETGEAIQQDARAGLIALAEELEDIAAMSRRMAGAPPHPHSPERRARGYGHPAFRHRAGSGSGGGGGGGNSAVGGGSTGMPHRTWMRMSPNAGRGPVRMPGASTTAVVVPTRTPDSDKAFE